MYKVTYLDKNGYVVTTDSAILVFDYLSDPSHALHHALNSNPDKPVIFFVTGYEDRHLNKSIYEIAQNHNRTYVMSNDVYPKNVPSDLAVAGMSKGDIVDDLPGGYSVKAYGTAGKGVAFLVTDKNGKHIFHAGTIDSPEVVDEIPEKKNDTDCPVEVAINRLASEVSEIEVAFFPADSNPDSHLAHHTEQFLKDIKVKYFFPIHIGSDDKRSDAYKAYAINGAQVEFLREPGQSFTAD